MLFIVFITILLSFPGFAHPQTRKPAKFSELAAYVGADREQLLVSGAKQEGKVVWYTSLAGGSYKAIIEVFESKYPDVKVEVYRAPGAELAVRMMEEAKARRGIADALETTTDTLRTLQEAKLLAPFNSPYLRNYPAGARENANNGLVLWTYARESYLGFAYNKTKIPASAVPKNFEGFANPELRERLAVGTGGTAPEIVGAIMKVKGEAFVRNLKSQGIRLFVLGSTAIRDQIATGEIEASPVIFQTHALEAQEKGAPVEWIAMDLVPVHAGGAVVAANPPHPHAALLMVDFLLSPDGQKVLEKFKYGSATKDYGFKRWYPQQGLTNSQYEREFSRWEKIVNSIVRKAG
ncbi:MAG TPA: extracellular solute-binding protein [Candidatus Binatia bacterium]|jgi:iron(III) transport system substrate-binding protein